MKKDFKFAFALIFLAALFLGVLIPSVFSYVMMLMKFIFFAGGIVCTGASIQCFSSILKEHNNKMAFENKKNIYILLFKETSAIRIVNFITFYRILICPVLLWMVFTGNPLFRWVLLSAFFSDVLDGWFARTFKAATRLGSILDSIADDCLFIVSVLALIHLHNEIIIQHQFMLSVLGMIFLSKIFFLWLRHRKMITSLHTYGTKAAAFLQAIFFLSCFFFQPNDILFDITILVTILALMEEIIIINMFKELKENTKGLFFGNYLS